MADAFQKDYPFIQVSILRAGSGVLINKILNEARAQKGLFDVLNTNDESVLPLKEEACSLAMYRPRRLFMMTT